MKEIERRIRQLEEGDLARRSEYFAISDCPEDDRGDQTQQTLNGRKVIYLLQDHVMSAEEWVDQYCTPD